jgi:hypothetical protein
MNWVCLYRAFESGHYVLETKGGAWGLGYNALTGVPSFLTNKDIMLEFLV